MSGGIRVSGALTVERLERLLVHVFRAGRVGRYVPVMIWGEAGIGKSETVARCATKLGVGFKDLRLGLFEAPDLLGVFRQQEVFPCFLDYGEGGDPRTRGRLYTRYALYAHLSNKHAERLRQASVEGPDQTVLWAVEEARKAGLGHLFGVRTVNSPPSWLPQPGTTGFLFLDEMNRATREVRQGSFQLTLDRTVGQIPLPDGWVVVSANNPPDVDGKGMGYGMVDPTQDAAFLSRFCHVALEPTAQEWLSWARLTGIDKRVRAFISMKGGAFLGSARPTQIPDLDPTPRSWTMLSKLVLPLPPEGPGLPPLRLDDDLVSAVASGLVGVEATRTWFALRMVPDPLVEVGDLVSNYATAYERLKKFLWYPTIDPETGEAIVDASGKTIYTRRSDLVRVAFESMTDALRVSADRDPPTQDLHLLATALRLVTDGASHPDQNGLGMEDVAIQYLKMWCFKPPSGKRTLVPLSLISKPPTDPATKAAFANVGVDSKKIVALILEIGALQGHVVKQAP